MRHRTLHAFAAVAVILIAFTPSAHADLQLILSANNGPTPTTVTINDNGAGDSNPVAGVITFIGHVGNWTLNTTTGTTGTNPLIDLNSVDTAGVVPTTLTIKLSKTNVEPGGTDHVFDNSIGGTLGGKHSLTYKAYANANNLLMATQHQLGTTMSFTNTTTTSKHFGSDQTGLTFVDPGPFSLTQVVTLTAGRVGSSSFNAALDQISAPETDAVTLLGCFLLSAWGIFRWKTRTA